MSDLVPARLTPLLPDDPTQVGPFPVVARIGSGGMGAVYASGSPQHGYTAVKVIHPELAQNADFRARFAREIDLVRRVATPYAPGFRGGDAESDPPWLATEYLPGPTLWDAVQTNGPLSYDALLGLAAGTAECLTSLHETGIVHRDLKPGNVILAEDGPKVLDFGIARALEGTGLTLTRGAPGTPGWVPPEVFAGSTAPQPARDVFTWGGIIAFAASGRPPFGSGPLAQVALRTSDDEPDLGDELQGPLRELVLRALAKDPEDRPAAADLLTEVTRVWEADAAPTMVSAADQRTRVDTYLQQHWQGYGHALPDVPEQATARGGQRRWPRFLAAVGAAAVIMAVVAAGATGYFLGGTGADEDEPATEDQAGAEEEAWPPQEAEQETDNLGHRNSVNIFDVDEDQTTTRAPLVFQPDDIVAEFHAHDRPQSGSTPTGSRALGTQALVAVPESRDDAVVFTGAMPFSEEALTPEMFTLIAPEGRYEAVEDFSLDYDAVFDQGDERWWADDERPYHTFTLTFVGAPERGLLSFQTTDYEANVQGSAPVGVCYEVDGVFTADYGECG